MRKYISSFATRVRKLIIGNKTFQFILLIIALLILVLYNYILIEHEYRFSLKLVLDPIIQFVLLISLFIIYKQQRSYALKLLISEQKYQSLFAFNSSGIFVVNLDGTINSASPSLRGTLYLPETDFKHQLFTDFLDLADKQWVEQEFNEIIQGYRMTSNGKVKISDGKGEYQIFEFSSAPLIIEDEIQGVIGFAKNISELEKVQEMLAGIQTQLNNIFESVDVAVWSFDEGKRKLTTISNACEKVLGYSSEDFYRNPDLWLEIVHPEDRESFEAWFTELFTANSRYLNNEYRILHSNGKIIWVENRVFPEWNASGEMTHINGVMIDITLKKNNEEEYHKDLELARLVQKSVLSLPVDTPWISLDARYIPSKHLGGDMYAWYRLDEHRYGIMIMDVMGHGVSASLICMSIRALLKGIIRKWLNPEEVIKELNDHMYKMFRNTLTPKNFYFTAIYLVVDKENNCIDYINAGHPSGLLMNDEGEIYDLESTGIPVGLVHNLEVKKKTIQLKGPARMILYTDGLIENRGRLQKKQVDLLKKLMVEIRMEPIPIFMDKLLAFRDESKQDDQDDVCLVCVEIKECD